MDDSCAVCAESLEWVAYGACGHKEVCSTCVARLRFICGDRRCCICKTESDVVFVTKALGDYTRLINNFSVFPSTLREGHAGAYWYHEGTQAIFDEVDHYKMIKAMCRLSCVVCDKVDDRQVDGSKRKPIFRNIEQLKGHLFHQHKLHMCSLCLEGRKVFISEQKLYTRTQLNQHISSGDSEVDGSGSERGGFTGHPICEFCRTPFYGDNELYSHMSTEHYTCHICQRQHPGQYDYFKNYDDLEIHFRRDHFLCEDEACLAKKFVVFQFEAEMKRHNTIEHGGRMSRAQRNAALQIPTSFRYRSGERGGQHRARGRTFRRDSSDSQLSAAIQASLETSNSRSNLHESALSTSLLYGAPLAQSEGDNAVIDPLIQPFEAMTTDSEQPARYLQAVSHQSGQVQLGESSFPPLPLGPIPNTSQKDPKDDSAGTSMKRMSANVWRKNQVNVLNSQPSLGSSTHAKPVTWNTPVPSSSHLQTKLATSNAAPLSASSASSSQAWPTIGGHPSTASNAASISSQAWPVRSSKLLSAHSPSSSKHSSGTNKISHSNSAPNLLDNGSFNQSAEDFPPVSAVQVQRSPLHSHEPLSKIEDVSAANKVLVETMRAALAYDEDKYGAFKEISVKYRQGSIGTEEYLVYVEHFGLSHLVLDLARLCPDTQKQRELLEIHNANMRRNGPPVNNATTVQAKDWSQSHKGKEKRDSRDSLADSVMSTVRELQSSYKPSDTEVEVLSKDGYRISKVKSDTAINQGDYSSSKLLKNQTTTAGAGFGSNQKANEDGRNKQRKKISKFNRTRLGDGSFSASMDPNDKYNPTLGTKAVHNGNNSDSEISAAHGVWQNGGSRKLFGSSN